MFGKVHRSPAAPTGRSPDIRRLAPVRATLPSHTLNWPTKRLTYPDYWPYGPGLGQLVSRASVDVGGPEGGQVAVLVTHCTHGVVQSLGCPGGVQNGAVLMGA